ncbi:MAG: hypothetical protein A3K03_02870 [Bdellovibrionales bacterium RIFOXYD1_FULL_44_7]|nr:MAG: hypothetical protein A3K03_02870 [Bdellovibrionales bacterium RIFOXYD1_FULL_44_7]
MTKFCFILVVLGIFGTANAFGAMSDMKTFRNAYPKAKTISKCSVCHEPDKKLNYYGMDYEKANKDLKAIEALDSDGDTVTNIAEVNKNTFPGDKNSH